MKMLMVLARPSFYCFRLACRLSLQSLRWKWRCWVPGDQGLRERRIQFHRRWSKGNRGSWLTPDRERSCGSANWTSIWTGSIRSC